MAVNPYDDVLDDDPTDELPVLSEAAIVALARKAAGERPPDRQASDGAGRAAAREPGAGSTAADFEVRLEQLSRRCGALEADLDARDRRVDAKRREPAVQRSEPPPGTQAPDRARHTERAPRDARR